MIRILKRFLFPTIITALVITIFGLFVLKGGEYDGYDQQFKVYDLMFGCVAIKAPTVELLNVSVTGVFVVILLIAGALVSWFDFKYDKYVVPGIFFITAIFIMLLPCTVNKTEILGYIIQDREANGDGYMTILVGPYVTASISLVIAIFALFKNKFNSIFKVAK